MDPLNLIETSPGSYSLLLSAGTTRVDALVDELGYEANGHFWARVALFLMAGEAPHLDGRFSFDPEGGMFCAYGDDQEALRELGAMMAVFASDPEKMRDLVESAQARDFDLED